MSVANESRRRSWFQFSKPKCEEDNANSSSGAIGAGECQQQQSTGPSHTLLERVTSLRRSLGKSQQKKNKIRPTSGKGLPSADSNNGSGKSKNSSTKKSSSPPAMNTATANETVCDDEIYGFTAANLDSSSSRRQPKSSFQHAPCDYESTETSKSGRAIRKDDERINSGIGGGPHSQDSPEWMKADAEFNFYHQHNQQKKAAESDEQQQDWMMYYYHQQYYQHGDVNSVRLSSAQHLSWTEPINEPDDIDRIYENMRGNTNLSTGSAHRSTHQNHRTTGGAGLSENTTANRKLTKDSGYESASTSASTWCAINTSVSSQNYLHSRSDSNASSVSTGGSLSPRVVASNKSSYHYLDPWSSAKSTSNLQLQVDVSSNNNTRRSSLTGNAKALASAGTSSKAVLPAKSVPGNLDKDTSETLIPKRSQNNNNHGHQQTSVYGLLSSKSGLDFAPLLKLSRKSGGSSCISENPFISKSDKNTEPSAYDNQSQLWKNREQFLMQNDSDSPPPTPPVRDSSLASNKRLNVAEFDQKETQQKAQQKMLWTESVASSESVTQPEQTCESSLYRKNQKSSQANLRYEKYSGASLVGHSKSLVNLRARCEESELKHHSQTYPLLPESSLADQKRCEAGKNVESWSSDHSVASSGTGITSLITSSDYYTASSSAMTHSPSLSSLNTSTTNASATFSYSRNSVSSTSSASSQIARSAKVKQPMRQESATVLYYEKKNNDGDNQRRESPPPPPPPPKMYVSENKNEPENGSQGTSSKMIYLDPSKKHKTSDTEIKAIQKRAVLQYFKQKQQKQQQNNQEQPQAKQAQQQDVVNRTVSSETNENNQMLSRKVQLVLQENLIEHESAPPSPPLPPPPSIPLSEIEVVSDLPLPPPPSPSASSREESLITSQSHASPPHLSDERQEICTSHQQASVPKPVESSSLARPVESVSSKSEIATQTTETLRRGSSGNSSKDVSTSKCASIESTDAMNQSNFSANVGNQVSWSNNHPSGGSVSSSPVDCQAPWSYNRLWPKQNNSFVQSNGTPESSPGLASASTSPITAATSFITNTGLSNGKDEDILAKKFELISRLSVKLDILRSEEVELNNEIEANTSLGMQILDKLKSQGISTQEIEKIQLHCDEIEKVTRLLLSLSARLQQNETEFKKKFETEINDSLLKLCMRQGDVSSNQLKSDDKSHFVHPNDNKLVLLPEMKSLKFKQDKLLAQLEEALQLKDSIDKRSQMIIERILKKYLTARPEETSDFIEFLLLKSKLIVEMRQIKDKIQLGEKQLQALKMF